MLANARGTRVLSCAGLALLSACSVLIDSDKKQCTKDTQCVAPYVCGSAGICSIASGCETNADCRQPGVCLDGMCTAPGCQTSEDDCLPNQLCNTDNGRCVNTASCKSSADCAPYEGAKVCILAEERCAAFECQSAQDCMEESPTAVCESGACVDDTWGCLGVDDPRRKENSSQTATLRLQVLSAPGEQIRVENLSVKVCAPLDPECTSPFNVKVTYDKDRYVVIEGLEAGKLFRIQLAGENQSNQPLLPGEYLMYRPAYGVTEDPLPILMFQAAFRDLAAAGAEAQVDPTLGFALMRIFDCSDREVAGVTVTPGKTTLGCGGDEKCRTAAFYPDSAWRPDPDANATTAGRAGILNMPTDVQSSITLKRLSDDKKVTSVVLQPLPGRITYIHFWPWNYDP